MFRNYNMKSTENTKISNFSAILIDLDGTLVDSKPIWNYVEKEFVEKFSKKPDLAFQDGLTGLTTKEIVSRMREYYLLSDSFEVLYAKFENLLMESLYQSETIEGAEELVQYLARTKIPMAIVSNSTHAMINAILEHKTWAKMLPIRFSSDDVHLGKPTPYLYLHAAKILNASPAECLVIEDSLNGVRASISAGMTCYAVLNNKSTSHELYSTLTPFVFGDLKSLLHHMMKISSY